MRIIALILGMAVLVLALVTAGWHADAHRVAGENEQLERQIARLEREASRAGEEVDRLRQPTVIEDRLDAIAKGKIAVVNNKVDANKKDGKKKEAANDSTKTPVAKDAAKNLTKNKPVPPKTNKSARPKVSP